mgnify:CR=1 FL=1
MSGSRPGGLAGSENGWSSGERLLTLGLIHSPGHGAPLSLATVIAFSNDAKHERINAFFTTIIVLAILCLALESGGECEG